MYFHVFIRAILPGAFTAIALSAAGLSLAGDDQEALAIPMPEAAAEAPARVQVDDEKLADPGPDAGGDVPATGAVGADGSGTGPDAAYRAAEADLLGKIAAIEESDNALSKRLIEPLETLADLYAENGDYLQAAEALKRARHLTHREFGLMSLEQMPLADQLTDVYLAQGQVQNANREQRLNHRVASFNYGAGDPRMVSVHEKLGQFYRRTGQWIRARENYRRAVQIVEQNYGATDLRLVPPLRGIAETYREQGEMSKRGLEALERVRSVHEQQEYIDIQERAQALAELGDSYLLYGQDDRALDAYKEAWHVLAADGETPDAANAFFGVTKKLSVDRLPAGSGSAVARYPLGTTAKFREGEVYVLVGFTVRPDGRTQNARVIESDAPLDLQREVRLVLRTSRFRPRLVDGEPIHSDPVRLRQRFVMERGAGG